MQLIAIGFMGHMSVFVNVSREEAIRLYCESESEDEFDDSLAVKEFDITDGRFEVYDIWK